MHIIYKLAIHDIKYISVGSRLEAPTIANGIKPTLADPVHNVYP